MKRETAYDRSCGTHSTHTGHTVVNSPRARSRPTCKGRGCTRTVHTINPRTEKPHARCPECRDIQRIAARKRSRGESSRVERLEIQQTLFIGANRIDDGTPNTSWWTGEGFHVKMETQLERMRRSMFGMRRPDAGKRALTLQAPPVPEVTRLTAAQASRLTGISAYVPHDEPHD